MAYARQRSDWKNYPDATTPIRAEDLNGIEAGLVAAASTADTALSLASTASLRVSDAETSATAAAASAASASISASSAASSASASAISADAASASSALSAQSATNAANLVNAPAGTAVTASMGASLARTPDALVTGAITRDANGAATSASVVWPDGTPGTYTALVVSTAFPGAVDSYRVTYGSPVTRTYTQPTVTRDATTGVAITVPAITVA